MIFINMKRVVIAFLLITISLYPKSLIDKYPSYAYVLSEFDIETGYIFDYDFEKFVQKYEKRLTRFYEASLKRGDFIIPTIKRGLIDNNMSDLLVYLSTIESGLNPKIKSNKKAVGLWQFIPSTAKIYKLEVSNCFDDRCDPYIATQAAIKHLKHLHHRFGKWYLAMIAYNCGEGRLSRAIKKAKTTDLRTLIDDSAKYLPKESRDYIRKIILLAMIGESKVIHFEPSMPDIIQVEVAGGESIAHIAKLIGIKPSQLLKLNAKYKNGKLPTKNYSYTILIPESKMVAFYKNYQLPPKTTQKSLLVSYHVKLGDTLESIATKFKTTVEDIKITNHLEDDFLVLGQLLVIPVDG
jgi:membrane-bound lytic murein transglycosylase D